MKRKRQEIVPRKTKIDKGAIIFLLNSGLSDTLEIIFALLRDRPVVLIELYNLIGQESVDPNVEPKIRELLSKFINHTFINLWFLAVKSSFPEIIYAYELDYMIKNEINIDAKSIGYQFIEKPFQTILNIRSTPHSMIYLFSPFSPIDSALSFYEDRLKKMDKPEAKDKSPIKKLSDLFNYTKQIKNDPLRKMRILHTTRKMLGISLKRRRIFYDIMRKLVNLFDEIIGEVKKVLAKYLDEGDDEKKRIMSDLMQMTYNISKTYSKSVYNNLIDNNYWIETNDDPIKQGLPFITFDKFIKHFDTFLRTLATQQQYSQIIFDGLRSFYSQIFTPQEYDIPTFVYEICVKVQQEIPIADGYSVGFYFKDDDFADNNLIDIEKFKWFYSYYNRETKKTTYLNEKEIAKVNMKLSKYWFYLLNYKLGLLSEEEKEKFKCIYK